MASEDDYTYALSSNQAWAGYKSRQNPSFFKTIAEKNTPSILWLGCSDARVPETTILGLQPGDIFVHRNVANIVSPTDLNTLAVIEHAVINLQVKHIILCGHTGCDMVEAALGDGTMGGILDIWLTPLRALTGQVETQMNGHTSTEQKCTRVAELNVEAGVRTLKANWAVRMGMKSRGVTVHGCMFDIHTGKVTELGSSSGGSKSAAATPGQVVRGNHGMLVFRGRSASMAIQ
ncbi:carbonic anhydrase [Sarocladium strictum]